MQSAAGGTSQRLKPAFAIVCSRSRIPNPAPDIVPAPSIVVIHPSPTAARAGHVCYPRSCCPQAPFRWAGPTLLLRTIFRDAPGSQKRIRVVTPDATRYAAANYAAAGVGLDLGRLSPRIARVPKRDSTSALPRRKQLGQKAGRVSIGKR